MIDLRTIAVLLALCGAPAWAIAQSEEPPAEPPTETEEPIEQEDAPGEAAPPDDGAAEEDEEALPSLDDLLDLEDPAGDTPDEVGAQELEEALAGQGPQGEPFVEAVALMDRAAGRIEDDSDLSLATQRIQQDAIEKLDKMIQQAKESQQQQSSSSSSSQSQDQQQTPDQQSKSNEQQQASGQGDNTQEMTPPGGEDAELNPVVTAARAAWGSLPERVRDALVQGSNESFSSLYRGLTEEYYQRLAEEPE